MPTLAPPGPLGSVGKVHPAPGAVKVLSDKERLLDAFLRVLKELILTLKEFSTA